MALTRSEIMSRIRSKGTKPEVAVQQAASRLGIPHHRNWPWLPGKPDLYLKKRGILVFVDGCFWHGLPCHYRRPKTNQAFWDAKIARNRARDRSTDAQLRAMGLKVAHISECAIKRLGPSGALLKAISRVSKGA